MAEGWVVNVSSAGTKRGQNYALLRSVQVPVI